MTTPKKPSHSRVSAQKSAKKRVNFAVLQEIPVLRPALVAAFSFVFGFVLSSHLLPINLSSAASNIDVQATASSTPTTQDERSVPEKTPAVLAAEAELSTSYAGAYAMPTSTASSAVSSSATASGLSIPALGINSSIVTSVLSNQELSVPAYGVSVYGSLYMGHSSGIFARLGQANFGQQIYVNGVTYTITSAELNQPVWANRKGVGAHHMSELINLGANRIVLMTCSGSYTEGFGWTGRTLVFATRN